MISRALLLVSLSGVCVVCVPAVSVRRGQNVSLPCSSDLMNSSSGLAWFRLRSDELRLIVSASRGQLRRTHMIIAHNEEPDRFGLEAAGPLESVRLLISAVSEADLGLYFCATAVSLDNMRFSTAIRLTLTGAERLSSGGVGCSALSIWIGVCVCVTCGFCGFLCACVLCHRRDSEASCVRGEKRSSSVQALPIQYSSLRFIRCSRAAAPAPAPADATYATIAKHTR